MKVKLLRDSRILHKAGEIVEVSPAEFNFLVSVGSAVEVAVKMPEQVAPEQEVETAEEKPKKKTTRKK